MAKKMYLVIGENTELPIADLISVAVPHVLARYNSQTELDWALNAIRSENLYEVRIKKGSKIILTYYNCALENYQVHYDGDGTISAYLYFKDNIGGEDDDEEEDEEETPTSEWT